MDLLLANHLRHEQQTRLRNYENKVKNVERAKQDVQSQLIRARRLSEPIVTAEKIAQLKLIHNSDEANNNKHKAIPNPFTAA